MGIGVNNSVIRSVRIHISELYILLTQFLNNRVKNATGVMVVYGLISILVILV